jgi:hypothetical protein
MYLMITLVLIAGAFAIAGTATAVPVSPWLSHIDAAPRVDLGLLRPHAKTPREAR